MDGRPTLQATFIGPLPAADVERTDAALRGFLRTVDFMLAHGESFNLDVNQNGTVDEVDAAALCYVLTFPELLGNSSDGSLASAYFRRVLLASLGSAVAPRYADLQQRLDRVQQILP